MMTRLNSPFFDLYKIRKGTLGINEPGVMLTTLEGLSKSLSLFSICFKRLYLLYKNVMKILINIINPSKDKSNCTSDIEYRLVWIPTFTLPTVSSPVLLSTLH